MKTRSGATLSENNLKSKGYLIYTKLKQTEDGYRGAETVLRHNY